MSKESSFNDECIILLFFGDTFYLQLQAERLIFILQTLLNRQYWLFLIINHDCTVSLSLLIDFDTFSSQFALLFLTCQFKSAVKLDIARKCRIPVSNVKCLVSQIGARIRICAWGEAKRDVLMKHFSSRRWPHARKSRPIKCDKSKLLETSMRYFIQTN